MCAPKNKENLFKVLLHQYLLLTRLDKLLLAGIVFLILVITLLGGLCLRLYPPAEVPIYPNCFFREFTGFSCAGCGTTRSLAALARGDFYASFISNPLLWAMGALALLLPFCPLQILRNKFFWGGVLITVFLYTVIRNIFGF